MPRSAAEVRTAIRGPVSSVPTIFTRDGTVDHDGIRSVVERSLQNRCEVVMLTWGNSLVSLLTDQELADVHRTVIDQVGSRALTVACDNMWGLPKTVEFGRFVRDLGYDVYMVRPAEWAPGTPEDVAHFVRTIAIDTPVMLVGEVQIRTCELLDDEPNLCAFKEDRALDRAHEILIRWGDKWPMIGGGGMQRHHLLWPHGHCDAWLDRFICCWPEPPLNYWGALQTNDPTAAWNVIEHIEAPLTTFANTARYGRDGVSKHALLELMGVAPRWRRSPAPNATDAEMDELRDFLAGLGAPVSTTTTTEDA